MSEIYLLMGELKKKSLWFFVFFALGLGLSAQAENHFDFEDGSLRSGDPTVAIFQNALKHLGYYKGKINNQWSKEVRLAMRQFQKQHTLTMTQKLDPITFATVRTAVKRSLYKQLGYVTDGTWAYQGDCSVDVTPVTFDGLVHLFHMPDEPKPFVDLVRITPEKLMRSNIMRIGSGGAFRLLDKKTVRVNAEGDEDAYYRCQNRKENLSQYLIVEPQ